MTHLGRRSRAGIAIAARGCVAAVALVVAAASLAGDLSVGVVDRAGRPVADVVVTVTPTGPRAGLHPHAPATAVMDQRNRAFVPLVLAVALGTVVEFPNNDSVSHQVYSFSAAKKFQLPLYKGVPHAPVTFDREGLVVLGCNIHDEMVGYVFVTTAPFFGTTGGDGMLAIKGVPDGDYRVDLWSPLVADPAATLSRTVHVAAHEPAAEVVRLARELRARPQPQPRRGDWEY
jgi:plastocyanin